MPVVASRVGGIPEVINNDNGILYTCGDVPGLRAALETLLRDPERRRLMGENGKRRVIQNFSADSMTRQIEQCYSQSIAKTTSLEHS